MPASQQQATGQAKYWNNPDGWEQTIAFLKSRGLRVICIDRNRTETRGLVSNTMPAGAEDQTGDRPLVERARWLRHASVFVGPLVGLVLAGLGGRHAGRTDFGLYPSNQ